MKESKYVVSLSGGKDSTAMLLKLLEEKRPIDYVIFCDTTMEYPEMYDHLDKIEKYTNINIIRLQAPHSFEYYLSEYKPKRKNKAFDKYDGLSWPGPKVRWCTALLKVRIVNKYLKELLKDYNIIQYIGIAYDEQKRMKKDANIIYPLVEYKMTESDCLKYCYEHGFDWGGLYEIFSRVSCWCCPLQSLDSLRKLREFFPSLWKRLEDMDEMAFTKFRQDYSVEELNIRFDFEKKRLSENKSIHSREFYSALKEILREKTGKKWQ